MLNESPSSSAFTAHAFSAPHPRTGKDTQYLLHRRRQRGTAEEQNKENGDDDDNKGKSVVSLLEASRFVPSHGSWLYTCRSSSSSKEKEGEKQEGAVCSDAGVLLLSEVDPLFAVLPALDSARALKQKVGGGEGPDDSNDLGRFVDAEAAVSGGERGEDSGKRAAAALPLLVALAGGREEEGGEEVEEGKIDTEMPSPSPSPPLSPPPSPRSRARSNLLRSAGLALSSVCETKTVGGDTYFRLCERRLETWLRLKARNAAAALKATGGPAFAGLEGEALEAAGGALLAEWLPRELSEKMGWPSPGGSGSGASASSSSRPGSAKPAAAVSTPVAPSWVPASEKTTTGPFTRDPNLPAETESFAQKEERYTAAGDFAKKMKLDAAAAAREKAKAVRKDAKAMAAKKEASTMKSLAGFFVVKKK